jgi:hypothetical protein
MLDLSILIVNWNTRQLLADCLASVFQAAADLALEVIVIDNASSDGSQDMVRQRFPQVRLIANTYNPGFAVANNQGLSLATGRYILLLNSDTVVPPQALTTVLQFMDHTPNAGLCGVKLLNPDGTFQGSFANFPSLAGELLSASGLGVHLFGLSYPSPRPRSNEQPRPVDWVAGAFMCLRREVFTRVGGMDESYYMYSEETDWCYRLRRTEWKTYYLPQVAITHFGGGSTQHRRVEMAARLYQSKVQFFAKHYGAVAALTLRLSLCAVFLLRGVLSSIMLALQPRQERWRYERKAAQAIRVSLAAGPTPDHMLGRTLGLQIGELDG